MIISLHPDLALEQALKCSYHNTRLSLSPAHRIGLTRACLPIGKNTNIIAIKCTLNSHFCILINVILSTLSSKARVKLELFNNHRWIFSLLIFFEFYLKCKLVLYLANLLAAHVAFIITQRPDSTINPNLSFDILNLIMKSFTFHAFKLKFEP